MYAYIDSIESLSTCAGMCMHTCMQRVMHRHAYMYVITNTEHSSSNGFKLLGKSNRQLNVFVRYKT